MAPTAGQSHDVVIKDDASVSTGFMLYRDGDAPMWKRSRAEVLHPSERSGQAAALTRPPNRDFIWEIDDLSYGFGKYRWPFRGPLEEQRRYAYSDGLWLDTENEITLAQALIEADVLIRNQGFERGDTTGWAATGTATIASGTTPNSGTFSLKMTFNGTGVGDAQHSCANPTVFQSRTVTFRVAARLLTATAGDSFAIACYDGSSETVGTSAALTTAYQEFTVTKALAAGATEVTIRLRRLSGGTAGAEVHCDDVAETARCGDSIKKFVDHRAGLYALADQCVYFWNTTNLVFEVVRMQTNANNPFGDLISFNDIMYVAKDSATAYEYATNPSVTPANGNWTAANQATNSNRDQQANFFVKVRNGLWKARSANTTLDPQRLAYTTDGRNLADGGIVWTELTQDLGSLNTGIFTGLFAFNDLPVAGTYNGLWILDRAGLNTIAATTGVFDVAPEYSLSYDSFNFSRATGFNGWLYVRVAPQGLKRYDGVNFQDISNLLAAPQFDDMTSRVLAINHDTRHLYALLDTIQSDNTATEVTWFASMEELRIGDATTWIVHTLHSLSLGGVTAALHLYNDTTTPSTIFAGGSVRRATLSANHAMAYRMAIPTLGTPAHSRSFNLRFTGNGVTPWWDGGYPDERKALRRLAIRLVDTSVTSTVKVEMQIDEDTSWTTLQTISNSDGLTNISIETQAATKKSARRVRFRVTLNAGTSTTQPRTLPTTSPKVKLPMVLHTTPMWSRDDELEFSIEVADNLPILSGMETTAPQDLLSILNGYIDNQTFPLTLTEDLDGDGTVTTYRIVVTDVEQTMTFRSAERGRVWLYRIRAFEVPI